MLVCRCLQDGTVSSHWDAAFMQGSVMMPTITLVSLCWCQLMFESAVSDCHVLLLMYIYCCHVVVVSSLIWCWSTTLLSLCLRTVGGTASTTPMQIITSGVEVFLTFFLSQLTKQLESLASSVICVLCIYFCRFLHIFVSCLWCRLPVFASMPFV